MRQYEILLVDQTNSVERIGAITAADITAALKHLFEQWIAANPDGYVLGLCECDETADTASLLFQHHTLRLIDTNQERTERDAIVAALAGNHSAE